MGAHDVLPVLFLGAHAVHVPYALTWAHEAAELGDPYVIEHMAQLPSVIERLSAAS